ncbi:DoxX family protein [Pedobacter miscanthi]|nr:DoxX family protein [Pedobacter miscanthi]
MNNNIYDRAQLFLRMSMGIGYLLPVMDRLGIFGGPGVNGNIWGNWENFVGYANTLMPYFGKGAAGIFAGLATLAEAVFALAFIAGFQIRLAAYGSMILTLIFSLSMILFVGFRAPFNYSVLVFSSASYILALIPFYRWSLDALRKTKRPNTYI